MQRNERVLDCVLGRFAVAEHDHSEPEKLRIVAPKQHLDEAAASWLRRGIAPAGGTPLTHRERLLRSGVRHARESFDRPVRLTYAHPGLAAAEDFRTTILRRTGRH